jgi:methylase of polypeptide subunit release factors
VARTFAEVGCGAGNTALPLLEMHPRATVYACDYSPRHVSPRVCLPASPA